jgi:hypothetical protein
VYVYVSQETERERERERAIEDHARDLHKYFAKKQVELNLVG